MSLITLARRPHRLVIVSLAAVVLTGCASQRSVRRLQSEVTNLRATIDEVGRQTEDVTQARTRLAEGVKRIESRMDELQAEVRRSAEESAHLRRRVESAESAVKEARALVDALPRQAALSPPEPRTIGPEGRMVAPEPIRPDSARAPAAEQVYASALGSFRAGEHGQAVLDFTDFVTKYPAHALAPDAQYWIGEAYYVQRDCRQAVVEYQRVLDYGARNARAPDALLKIGLCQATLREPVRAQQTWQRLVREYPVADAATRARALLRARGGTGRP